MALKITQEIDVTHEAMAFIPWLSFICLQSVNFKIIKQNFTKTWKIWWITLALRLCRFFLLSYSFKISNKILIASDILLVLS